MMYLDKYEGEGYGCDWIVAECSLEDEVEEGSEHRVLGHGLDKGLPKPVKKRRIKPQPSGFFGTSFLDSILLPKMNLFNNTSLFHVNQ